MNFNFYRFKSSWNVHAVPADVYRALDAMDQYPEWWREVRAVQRLDAGKYRLHVRSLLPYDLIFTGTEWERDAQAGILSIRMEGDLEGFSRWTISPSGSKTTVTFDEEVIANKPLLRRLSLVGRPAFKWNHALMMRHCRSGLRACLAGIRLARSEDDGEQRQD